MGTGEGRVPTGGIVANEGWPAFATYFPPACSCPETLLCSWGSLKIARSEASIDLQAHQPSLEAPWQPSRTCRGVRLPSTLLHALRAADRPAERQAGAGGARARSPRGSSACTCGRAFCSAGPPASRQVSTQGGCRSSPWSHGLGRRQRRWARHRPAQRGRALPASKRCAASTALSANINQPR